MGAKSEAPVDIGYDIRLIKALSHPVRVQILNILNQRNSSPGEMAKQLGYEVEYLSYHVRTLKNLDCIELIDTEEVGASVRHIYRATARAYFDENLWARIPASIRSGISGAMWGDIGKVVGASVAEGSFDSRSDRHFSWTPIVLDEEGWGEIRDALLDVLPVVLEAGAKSSERMRTSGEPGINAAALMTLFETPPLEKSPAI